MTDDEHREAQVLSSVTVINPCFVIPVATVLIRRTFVSNDCPASYHDRQNDCCNCLGHFHYPV